jgi:anti-anti-sigma factor
VNSDRFIVAETFIIRLEGEFDLSERERLTDAFGIARSTQLVIVDFEKTAYVDSTVLHCLVALDAATRKRNAQLVLTGLGTSLQRVFKICSLDRYFDIRRSLSEVHEADLSESLSLTLVAQTRPPSVTRTSDRRGQNVLLNAGWGRVGRCRDTSI